MFLPSPFPAGCCSLAGGYNLGWWTPHLPCAGLFPSRHSQGQARGWISWLMFSLPALSCTHTLSCKKTKLSHLSPFFFLLALIPPFSLLRQALFILMGTARTLWPHNCHEGYSVVQTVPVCNDIFLEHANSKRLLWELKLLLFSVHICIWFSIKSWLVKSQLIYSA